MARLGDPVDTRLVVILLRSLKHWTKEKLSQESGVDKGLLSDYERGKLAPSRRNLTRIAAAVGVTGEFALNLIPICRRMRLAYERALGGASHTPAFNVDSLLDLTETMVQAALTAADPFLLELAALPPEDDLWPEDHE